jgi:hypothetical protein
MINNMDGIPLLTCLNKKVSNVKFGKDQSLEKELRCVEMIQFRDKSVSRHGKNFL